MSDNSAPLRVGRHVDQGAQLLEVAGVFLAPPDCESAVKHVEQFCRTIEGTFAQLAERLAELSQETQQLLAGLETFRVHSRLHLVRVTVPHANDVVAGVQAEHQQLCADLAELGVASERALSFLARLSPLLNEISEVSFDLNMTGLNAALTTRRLGKGGSAFTELSAELTRLTDQCQEQVARLLQISERTENVVRGLVGAQGLADPSSTTGGQTEASLTEMFRALATAFTALTTVAEHCSTVVRGIHEIILALQNFDIVRQGLEHVGMILHEAGEAYARGRASQMTTGSDQEALEYLRFAEQSGVLGCSLVSALREDMAGLTGECMATLQTMGQATEVLAEAESQMTAQIGEQLEAPANALLEIQRSVAVQVARCEQYGRAAAALQESSQDLLPVLEEMARTRGVLGPVALLMRTEATRVATLQQAEEIVTVMDQVTAEIDEANMALGKRNEDALQALQELESCSAQVRDKVAKVGEFGARLGEIESRMVHQPERILSAGKEFVEGMQRLVKVGDGLRKSIAGAERDVAAFVESEHGLSAVDNTCQRMASEARAALAQLEGHPLARHQQELFSDHLRSLIERFTTLAHKRLAAQVTGAALEDGDEGGTLTLF